MIPNKFVDPAPCAVDEDGSYCTANSFNSVAGPVTHFYRHDAMSRLSQESKSTMRHGVSPDQTSH